MRIISLLTIVLFIGCKENSKTKEQTETIKLQYIGWACECANWANLEDANETENLDRLADKSIFIEPADENNKLPDSIGYSGDVVEFTGNFYPGKRYPKDYVKTEQDVKKAKVFRYQTYKVIRSNAKNYKEF